MFAARKHAFNKPFSKREICIVTFQQVSDLLGAVCRNIKNQMVFVERAFATRLNAKGVEMRTIQKADGDRNIRITALYCEVSDETMRNAVELGIASNGTFSQ